MPLFLLLFAVPLIEIALFVTIGDRIGLWWTLGTVLATAALGTWALRRQGVQLLRRAQRSQGVLELPDLLSEGMLVFTSGLLLLTPGFLTDAIGLALLVPPVRRAVARLVIRRAAVFVRSRSTDGGSEPADSSGSARDPNAPNPRPADAQTASDAASAPNLARRRPRPGSGDVEDAIEIDPRDRRPDA